MEVKKYSPCEEMVKLRNWLDQKKIKWWDLSDEKICRTKFVVDGNVFSIVNGHGTYGHLNGLLEMMVLAVTGPIGWLTAQAVIDFIEENLK